MTSAAAPAPRAATAQRRVGHERRLASPSRTERGDSGPTGMIVARSYVPSDGISSNESTSPVPSRGRGDPRRRMRRERGTSAGSSVSPPSAPPPVPTRGAPHPADRRGARVLVALERDNRVAILGARPRWHVLRRTRVPAGPHNLTATSSIGAAAVTSPPAHRVTLLDGAGRIIARARVPAALMTPPSRVEGASSGSPPRMRAGLSPWTDASGAHCEASLRAAEGSRSSAGPGACATPFAPAPGPTASISCSHGECQRHTSGSPPRPPRYSSAYARTRCT